jgi:hypothetical protein
MAKKINLDEIDESFIVSAVKKDKSSVPENPERLLAPSTVKEVEQVELPKEESRRKRNTQDYENLFIRESNITARLGKTVYIRKEFHDRILKIVQVIGGNEVSLFSYIDNVLAHHFDAFQEDISLAYKQNISKDVF